jgi:arabinan endo-1,5-alpha-L-arabinosidase
MLQQFLLTLAAFTALSLSSAIPNTNQLNKRGFSNGPVITENFPDPSIINVGGKWYSFATNNGNSPPSFHVQIAESDDFTTWNYVNQDAMPDMSNAEWSNGQNVWAPDVSQIVSLVHPFNSCDLWH